MSKKTVSKTPSTEKDTDTEEKTTVEEQERLNADRHSVRLTTVFCGRICQYGKAYECTISDVSIGGAKVRLKDPQSFNTFVSSTLAQLVFERLTDYKALNAEVVWLKPDEFVVGLEFVDPENRRRSVIKKLMPNRWRIANEERNKAEAG
ncbi:MAG: PilZ domain-containing protein [Magnetovibrio sp.]|nr:PilZ domain-containing protein [Magnetovibrio sp.]